MTYCSFFKKVLFIPLTMVVMLAVYLVYDPFEVVYTYKTHNVDSRISYNWDYNATETLIQIYSSRHYDSFIFGNSRSLAFHCKDWQRYLDSTRTLHFAAPSESLYGLYTKFKYLADNNMPIRNSLIMLDSNTLAVTWDGSGHLFIKHPELTGNSRVNFQRFFFRAFIDPSFFLGYVCYKATGNIPELFKRRFTVEEHTDPVTCDKIMVALEKLLTTNSEQYYVNRKEMFYSRDETKQSYSPMVIKSLQLFYLKEIKKILAANGTNYKIIINPNYDQKYLSKDDLVQLREIFGTEYVYDYSGINDITSDFHNYYDAGHFRPHLARQIMAEVYGN